MSAQDRDWFPHLDSLTGEKLPEKGGRKLGDTVYNEKSGGTRLTTTPSSAAATVTSNVKTAYWNKRKHYTPVADCIWILSIAVFVLGFIISMSHQDPSQLQTYTLGVNIAAVSVGIWSLAMLVWMGEMLGRRSGH